MTHVTAWQRDNVQASRWPTAAGLAARRAERTVAVDARIKVLEECATNADDRLRRLYKIVEDGIAELDESLKDPITAWMQPQDPRQRPVLVPRVGLETDSRRSGANTGAIGTPGTLPTHPPSASSRRLPHLALRGGGRAMHAHLTRAGVCGTALPEEANAPTDPWSTGGGIGSVGASPRGQGHIMLLFF